MAVLLSSPEFGLNFFKVWEILFGIAAVVCCLTAWKWRNRKLRALSLMSVMAAATSRGMIFFYLTNNPTGIVVYFMLAYLEWLLWPHILPPHIMPSDLLTEDGRYQIQDIVTGEILWPPEDDDS